MATWLTWPVIVAMWVSPCHVSSIGLGSNRMLEMHARTLWINAWCRSMLISKDQTSKLQPNSKDSHGHLSQPLPYGFSWLEGWTEPGRDMPGHFGSMLDTDQCWSPRIKLPKFNQIQKTHMATWVSPFHMGFLGWRVEQNLGDTCQDTLDQCLIQINADLQGSDYPVPKLSQNCQERPCHRS